MRKINLAFLIVALCAIQACRNPEPNKNEKTNSRDITHESSFDDDSSFFMKEAGAGGLMEVEMANIALKNAADPKVRAFAQQMVTDHGRINKELSAIARKAGMIIPTAVISEKQADLDMLNKLSGAAFDKQYMDMMVKDHQKTLELFKSGQQSDKEVVVEFAKKNIPVIEQHFALAKSIVAGMK